MDLEKKLKQRKIKIRGYREISSEEFYKLKPNQGLRVFDYHQNCKQMFYKRLY